jgi:predicted SnoaL-like aldol condensation-catalyzing enzyme
MMFEILFLRSRKMKGRIFMHTRARKQAAVEFLQLIVAGRIDEAYEKHVDMQGKHHNPFFHTGFPALKEAMIENHVQFPGKQLTVKNVISDGDLVAVYSHIVLRAGETGVAAVHLFRFHGDKIVEMWDSSQPVPVESPNKDGAF